MELSQDMFLVCVCISAQRNRRVSIRLFSLLHPDSIAPRTLFPGLKRKQAGSSQGHQGLPHSDPSTHPPQLSSELPQVSVTSSQEQLERGVLSRRLDSLCPPNQPRSGCSPASHGPTFPCPVRERQDSGHGSTGETPHVCP